MGMGRAPCTKKELDKPKGRGIFTSNFKLQTSNFKLMNPDTQVIAYVSGVSTLLVLWILYRVYSGTWSVQRLIEGADGHPSTSKLQWFLWTVVVLFSYVMIYAAQAANDNFAAIANIPDNLLIAMGISSFSMVAAKGITVSQVQSGQVVKPQADPQNVSLGSIVQDDAGYPDLSKIQIMAWTLIAIVVYLLQVNHTVADPTLPSDGTLLTLTLPDIGGSLMLLMGLGHGAYLGKKLVSTSASGNSLSGNSVSSNSGNAGNGGLANVPNAASVNEAPQVPVPAPVTVPTVPATSQDAVATDNTGVDSTQTNASTSGADTSTANNVGTDNSGTDTPPSAT